MSELITQAAYAELRGVSRQAINNLVKRGKLVLVDGKIDLAVADALLRDRVNPARSKTAAGAALKNGADGKGERSNDDSSRFYRARADREETEAELARLELARLRGEVLEREPVERGLFEAARMLRDQVLIIPKRIAGDLAMKEAPYVEERLTSELRRALSEFSKLADAAAAGSSNKPSSNRNGR